MRPRKTTILMRGDELTQIVSDYIAKKRAKAQAERRWFVIQPTLEGAISKAARAIKPSGKRFGHQRRIPKSVLRQSETALLDIVATLQAAKTFEQLHQIISSTIGAIHGIGELTIYDTSLRIGAKLGLEPTVVFLHAGTRQGARALGLDHHKEFIEKESFSREFQPLSASEMEDVLCIYKDRLRRTNNRTVRTCN